MKLEEIKNIIDAIIFKEQSGNTTTYDEFNRHLHVANLKLFEYYKKEWEETHYINNSIARFLVNMQIDKNPLPIDDNGIAKIPNDYAHISSIIYYWSENECTEDLCLTAEPRIVEIVKDAKRANRLSNPITKPTKKHPVCFFRNNYILFEPKDLKQVEFTYFRMPRTPVLNVVNANNVPAYVNNPQKYAGGLTMVAGTTQVVYDEKIYKANTSGTSANQFDETVWTYIRDAYKYISGDIVSASSQIYKCQIDYIADTLFNANYWTPLGTISFLATQDILFYDRNTSVELEWNDFDCLKIASYILQRIGIHLRDNEISQYAQMEMQTEVKDTLIQR